METIKKGCEMIATEAEKSLINWLEENKKINGDIQELLKEYRKNRRIMVKQSETVTKKSSTRKKELKDFEKCFAKTAKGTRCTKPRDLEGKDDQLCKMHNKNTPKNGKMEELENETEEETKNETQEEIKNETQETKNETEEETKSESVQEEEETHKLEEIKIGSDRYYKDEEDNIYEEREDDYIHVGKYVDGEIKLD